MRNEEDIRRLLRTGMEPEGSRTRALRAVSLARRRVGGRDTLGFALFRLWAVLARLFAPLFAIFSQRQAEAIYRQQRVQPARSIQDPDNKGEST